MYIAILMYMRLKTTNDEAQEVSLALNINNNITQHSTKTKKKNQVDYHSKIILLFYDCNV